MFTSVEFLTGLVVGALAYYLYLKWCMSRTAE